MKVYKVFTTGQTGPVHPKGNDLACAGFIMNSNTTATFKTPNGITFELVNPSSDGPKMFDVSVSEVTDNAGTVIILG